MTETERRQLKAHATGNYGFGFGGSVDDERYADVLPSTSRVRCHCGCGKRSTHAGMANGVGLTSRCELHVRRWVRSPEDARAAARPPLPSVSTQEEKEGETGG